MVIVALLASAGIAGTTVLITKHDADVVIERIGPLRTETALLLRNVVDAETGLRGYQVTATTDMLDPYRKAEQAIPRLLRSMRARATGDARFTEHIDVIGDRIYEWFNDHAQWVILGVAQGDPSATDLGRVEQGKAIIDDIRSLSAEFEDELRAARTERMAGLDRVAYGALVAILLTLGLALVALTWRGRKVRIAVTTPLQELERAIEALDVGAGTLHVEVHGAREVELLASTLEDLASRTASLTASNADRLLEERLVRHLTKRVREALGRQDVLERAASVLGSAAQADHVVVFAVTDGQVDHVLVEWQLPGITPFGIGHALPEQPGLRAALATIVSSRDLIVADDLTSMSDLPEAVRKVLLAAGAGAALLAPAVSAEVPIALVAVLESAPTGPWSPLAATAASAVADDLATALTHARLYEREQEMVDRLQGLDQAKNDFVSSVSHELRTPLTSIRGYVELLRDGEAGELGPEQDHMLGIVERNSERLLALIEDLLTLSRVESGAFRTSLVSVDMAAVVRTAADALAPQAAAASVELVIDLSDAVPAVRGDPTQLERVLLNLLSNAIKFSESGGRVELRLSAIPTEVSVTVQDHGIGIPEAEQTDLFTRFFRSSSAQDRAIPGTGLGLVIVQSIVEHHGGTIELTSTPGAGTTVHLTLPTADAIVES